MSAATDGGRSGSSGDDTRRAQDERRAESTRPETDGLSSEELSWVAGGLSTDPSEDEPFLPGTYKSG